MVTGECCVKLDIMDTTNDIIRGYFLSGLHYDEILAFLYLTHGIYMSLFTLKRRLKTMRLSRKKNFSELRSVVEFIESELKFSGQLCGYRWIHQRCIQRGFVVTQDTVRVILQELDPVGVEYRKRKRLRRRRYVAKGPNYIWHMDSYDKLKPYGIAINGAIDGSSRHIVWLRAGRTASNPKVIGGYYIEAVKKFGGCPRLICFDCGTENVGVEKFLQIFRETPVDNSDTRFGEKSFLYGTSQHNQRIESWWAMLRKHSSQFWLNLFQKLREQGEFTGSELDKALIQFSFLNVLQEELDQVSYEWNTHSIRASRNAIAPKGRPVIMFELPELYGTRNFMCPVDNGLTDACENECLFFKLPCETDIFELCKIIVNEKKMESPQNPQSASSLYL